MSFWDTLAGFANPIGSLVGGVVNGVSNLISTNSTNKANKDISESQLSAQKEYWKQQQQNWLQERRWSLEDRAYENNYNSPLALKSRYLAAGINPYLAMQGQSSPSSVQAVSPSAPNAPNVPSPIPMQSPDLSGFGLGIQNGINTYLNSRMNETQIASLHTKMQNETAETIARIERMGIENEETRQIINNMKLDWKFNDETYSTRKNALEFATEGARLDNERRIIENEIADLQRSMSKTQQANLQRRLDAEWNEIMSRVRANDAAAARDLAIKVLTDIQSEGASFDNELKLDMADAIVDKAYCEADFEYWKGMREAKHVRLGAYLGDNTPDPVQAKSGGSQYINWKKRGKRAYSNAAIRKRVSRIKL